MKNYDLMRVRNCLQKLHKGDAISDKDLVESIDYLSEVLFVFRNIDIISMPEYDVFEKALNRDLITLQSYEDAR